jgi:hypothetical protein
MMPPLVAATYGEPTVETSVEGIGSIAGGFYPDKSQQHGKIGLLQCGLAPKVQERQECPASGRAVTMPA